MMPPYPELILLSDSEFFFLEVCKIFAIILLCPWPASFTLKQQLLITLD